MFNNKHKHTYAHKKKRKKTATPVSLNNKKGGDECIGERRCETN